MIARAECDAAIIIWADTLDADWLAGDLVWTSAALGREARHPRGLLVTHMFNHQTHHRGQAHALLTSMIGNERTPSFDLIIYQRETGQGGLRKTG